MNAKSIELSKSSAVSTAVPSVTTCGILVDSITSSYNGFPLIQVPTTCSFDVE